MEVSQNVIAKMKNLPSDKYNLVVEFIDQLSQNPMDIFDSMREDAKQSLISEDDADDFVYGIRKERNASCG